MGLHNQLTDISTDSITLLIITTIATVVADLRYIFKSILNLLSLNRTPNLTSSNLVAHQLSMNRTLSHKYGESKDDESSGGGDCMVCLCKLRKGDQVRRLACCHVFHKSCFDGWLHHLNFNCPLCRSTLVSQSVYEWIE